MCVCVWNHLTVFKRIHNKSYIYPFNSVQTNGRNYIFTVTKQYMKPFNYIPKTEFRLVKIYRQNDFSNPIYLICM